MAADTAPDQMTRRPGASVRGFLRAAWRWKIVKAFSVLAGLFVIGFALLWVTVIRTLPPIDGLSHFEPQLPTNVRGIDGAPVYSYARERRVELSFAEYPRTLVNAFLAAEDKNFFQHHGIDYLGMLRAAWTGLTSGSTPRGTSTITQQVAKNLLVGNEASYSRKLKEALLAWKIENNLSKQQILELCLNQIALGRNAFGVEAAAQAYFDKELPQLDLAQCAFLAILPKGPANYDPYRHPQRALERRHYVLADVKNGFITQPQYAQADAEPIGAILRQTPKYEAHGGYFVEEVRRQLIAKFGETARDGPFGVYSGGLWVRTSFDPRLQAYAQQALRDGLLRYDHGRGWSGPVGHGDIDDDDWQQTLLDTNIALDYSDWRAAIVISRDAGAARIGFADGQTGTLPASLAAMPVRGGGGTAFAKLAVGDIIAVAPQGSQFALRSLPKISGGFVVEQPQTGRILAMQGGFDSSIQLYNRATQALRQPGSTIKPIVYSAALENGMTPASIIEDAPYCVEQGARLGRKCFVNFGGGQGSGPHTMRWGIEQSRNLMTVRAAAQTGMPKVVKLMKDMNVGVYEPYLAYALGAGVTTVTRMVNAYSVLANQGRWHAPTLIDFVQDRHGRVIWPENWRACDGCNAPDWNGGGMPRPTPRGRQVVDAMTAYQMVHITEGVVQRGTAVTLRDLGRPMFGKTGTNSGPTDVWFVGGTPQMVGGLYMGYDHPANLGGYAQGGTLAAPIFKAFALKAFEGMEKLPFVAPQGIRMVRIDRASGHPVYGAWPSDDPKAAVIWEAFKPESEPRRYARHAAEAPPTTAPPQPQRPAATEEGTLQTGDGIY